jgi:hypothetical protein
MPEKRRDIVWVMYCKHEVYMGSLNQDMTYLYWVELLSSYEAALDDGSTQGVA